MTNTERLNQILHTPKGEPLRLTALQSLIVDFIQAAHEKELLPAIFTPMGSGTTTIGVGLAALWSATLDPPAVRFVCDEKDAAEDRAMAMSIIIAKRSFQALTPLTEFKTAAKAVEDCPPSENKDAMHTIFDSCFSFENCVVDRNSGISVTKQIMNYWWPSAVRAVLFGTAFKHGDPANRLAHDEQVATLKVGVNRDFNAYRIEILGLSSSQSEALCERYRVSDFKRVGASMEVHSFDIALARPTRWYEERRKEDPLSFDTYYRLSGLEM